MCNCEFTPTVSYHIAAREGGQTLQTLAPGKRADVINRLANLLLERQADILAANKKDLDLAKEQGIHKQCSNNIFERS